jgi:hypothetical protein
MLKLKASKDRKVANAVNAAGTLAAISNTFGLPAGSAYSCPGMTEVCGGICYANALEKCYPSVRALLLHNWDLVKDADEDTTFALLDDLITEFVRASVKRGADLVYRCHWDGDFFSETYTAAWIRIFRKHADVQFWLYTRVAAYAVQIHKAGLQNVSLYFSTDRINQPIGAMLNKVYGIRLAYLADTFDEGQAIMREITGRPGAKCPEQVGAYPLISTEGSACTRCGLCIFSKANIVFSASKK